MTKERGLGELLELLELPRECAAETLRAHRERADLLAGQRFLKKEFGSAPGVAGDPDRILH